MKKIFSIFAALFCAASFISCDKDPDVDFSKDHYTLHYDQKVQLGITTENAEASEFSYSSADKKVVTVNNSGLASGVFVGSTTVTVNNGTVSDKCKVTVIPYETFFEAPLLNIATLTKEGLKSAENRVLQSEEDDILIFNPLASEYGVDHLIYDFSNENVVYLHVILKYDIIDDEAVTLFLDERYARAFETSTSFYIDHNTEASIYNDGYSSIKYTFLNYK